MFDSTPIEITQFLFLPRAFSRDYIAALHIGSARYNKSSGRVEALITTPSLKARSGPTIIPLSCGALTSEQHHAGLVRGAREKADRRLAILKMIIARATRAARARSFFLSFSISPSFSHVSRTKKPPRSVGERRGKCPCRRERNAKAPAECRSALILSNARELVISTTPQSSRCCP